jgi:hypothetical protein
LKYVKVIDAIRLKFYGLEADDAGPAVAAKSAVAEDDAAAVAETDDDESDDPMDALDAVTVTTKTTNVKATSNPPKHLATRSLIKSLEMPNRPPCVASDDARDTSTIVVYRDGRTHGNSSLCMRTDGVDWLLAYAADELFFQGVPQTVKTAVADTKLPNCLAVPDLHLEWNFATKAWTGEFISGPFVGVTRIFSTADLTAQRLTLMRDAGIGEKVEHLASSATLLAKHRAKALITLWCKAIVNGDGDFETNWGLTNKRALPLDDEAAVAESAVAGRRTRSRGVQLSLEAAFSEADPVPPLRRSGAKDHLEVQEQSSQS